MFILTRHQAHRSFAEKPKYSAPVQAFESEEEGPTVAPSAHKTRSLSLNTVPAKPRDTILRAKSGRMDKLAEDTQGSEAEGGDDDDDDEDEQDDESEWEDQKENTTEDSDDEEYGVNTREEEESEVSLSFCNVQSPP